MKNEKPNDLSAILRAYFAENEGNRKTMFTLSKPKPRIASNPSIAEVDQRRLGEWLKLPTQQRWLDAGGNARLFLNFLEKPGDWHKTAGPNASFTDSLAAEFSRLPYADGYFDVTVGVHLLEQVTPPELPGVYDELTRVTQGRLLLLLANQPPLSTQSVRCPHCGEAYHAAGHLHHLSANEVIKALERRGFRLCDQASLGTDQLIGEEMNPLLFQKHFWEHQFYGSTPCPECEKLPVDYYQNYDVEAALGTLQRNLARHWFKALSSARIEKSLSALLFERSPKPSVSLRLASPKQPSTLITPSVKASLQTQPQILPMTSYLVVDAEIMQRTQVKSASIVLTPGNYSSYFITSMTELRVRASASVPMALHFAWTGHDGERYYADSLIGEEVEQLVIPLEVPPLLNREGAELQIQIKPLRPTSDAKLWLQTLEACEALGPMASVESGLPESDQLATSVQDYLGSFHQYLCEESHCKIELARMNEEEGIWKTTAERLFWECSQLHDEYHTFQIRHAQLEDRCTTMARQMEKTTMEMAIIRSRFEALFFSLKFLTKQIIKIMMAKIKIWPCPDPKSILTVNRE